MNLSPQFPEQTTFNYLPMRFIKFGFLFLLLASISSTAVAQNGGYWQQHAEYTMDIDVDAEKHQYKGKQKLVYTNNSPDELTRVYYHLYFNAFQPNSMMDVRSRSIPDPDGRVRDRISKLSEDEIGYQRITSLKQDGKSVTYETEGSILVVELDKPIKPGKKTTFEMEWDAQVPLQVRRSGRDNAEGVEFTMTQWYPKLAEYDFMGWHPNPYIGREFHGVWGNFDVTIHMDSSYVIASTGVLQNPEQIGHGYDTNGKQVRRPNSPKLSWNFVAKDVHDFAWGADPDFVHTTAQVPNGPLLHFFYQDIDGVVAENADDDRQPALKQAWENLPGYTVGAFEFANEKFGKYPFPQFSVVQGGDGGMEYPMLTMITGNRSLGSMVGVTVHEMYHNWYQGVLATNEALFAWMDEGFTVFASSETMSHLFNGQGNPHRGSYAAYRNIVRNGLEEALDTHSDHFERNGAYGTASYSKGSTFLYQLNYIIGDEAFRKGMLTYFDEWGMKHPTSQDFMRIMEKESGMVLDWYHEYFIQSTKTIDYEINSVLGTGDQTIVHLKKNNQFPMPLDIVVEYTDGSMEEYYIPIRLMRGEKPAESNRPRTVLGDWIWVNDNYTFTIPSNSQRIKRIVIDPSERLADIDVSNNVFDLGALIDENN